MGRARGARQGVCVGGRWCKRTGGVDGDALGSLLVGEAATNDADPLDRRSRYCPAKCIFAGAHTRSPRVNWSAVLRELPRRASRVTRESVVVFGPLPRPRGKKPVAAVLRRYVLPKKRQEAAAELPRENARLASPDLAGSRRLLRRTRAPSRQQNTPGGRRASRVKTSSSTCLPRAHLGGVRWASRPTAAPPQLWGRRAAANGLLTRGTRADGGAARAREARPGPELRPGQ